MQFAYGMTVNIFVSLNISTLAWCITWGLLLCWQKYKLSALVRYRQSSRAERQLRKITLHLFIKFFIGHLQPGWKLENPAQQASPVRYTQAKDGAIRFCWSMWLEVSFSFRKSFGKTSCSADVSFELYSRRSFNFFNPCPINFLFVHFVRQITRRIDDAVFGFNFSLVNQPFFKSICCL